MFISVVVVASVISGDLFLYSFFFQLCHCVYAFIELSKNIPRPMADRLASSRFLNGGNSDDMTPGPNAGAAPKVPNMSPI